MTLCTPTCIPALILPLLSGGGGGDSRPIPYLGSYSLPQDGKSVIAGTLPCGRPEGLRHHSRGDPALPFREILHCGSICSHCGSSAHLADLEHYEVARSGVHDSGVVTTFRDWLGARGLRLASAFQSATGLITTCNESPRNLMPVERCGCDLGGFLGHLDVGRSAWPPCCRVQWSCIREDWPVSEKQAAQFDFGERRPNIVDANPTRIGSSRRISHNDLSLSTISAGGKIPRNFTATGDRTCGRTR